MDGLTGLHNRRHLDEGLSSEWARAGREGTSILDGAREVAEAIRLVFFNMAALHDHSDHARVTISIGVAAVDPASGMHARDLLEAADSGLYAAKEAGRNRVSVGGLR